MHRLTTSTSIDHDHSGSGPRHEPDTLDLARAAHDELRDLARMAAERQQQVIRVLTAIEHQRTEQTSTSFQTAMELDGMRDELLDLLGRIHAATDPYAAWAVSEPEHVTDAGQDQPVPSHDRPTEGLPRIAALDGPLTVVPAEEACALVGVDDQGRISTWNLQAERLLGWSAAEVVGRPLNAIVPADEALHVSQQVGAIIGGEEVTPFVSGRLHRDGHQVDVMVTPVAVFTSGNNNVVGAIAFYDPVRQAADAA
ncbi:MAG: PAS domain S-box protein [Actinomycetes bacterium]